MPSIANHNEYDDDFKLKALELAAAIGQRPAARQLQIPAGTVQEWCKHPKYVERYSELRKQQAPKWRERAAATLEELVDGYTQLEVDALSKAAEVIEKNELEPRDVANFLRSVAVAKGVTADHVAKLRGQPTHIVERRADPVQLEQAMAKLLNSVESTAEELPPAPELDEGDE